LKDVTRDARKPSKRPRIALDDGRDDLATKCAIEEVTRQALSVIYSAKTTCGDGSGG
jgi:hypothetical protein